MGQPCVQFKATDKDQSVITYSIQGGNDEDKFAIDSKTGECLQWLLDYPKRKQIAIIKALTLKRHVSIFRQSVFTDFTLNAITDVCLNLNTKFNITFCIVKSFNF